MWASHGLDRFCVSGQALFKMKIQGEFEGVFPKDLRRRTATRTKFGAHFWRRLIANIDLAQNDPKDPFGATIWQRFGEAIKHLCVSIFEIMI